MRGEHPYEHMSTQNTQAIKSHSRFVSRSCSESTRRTRRDMMDDDRADDGGHDGGGGTFIEFDNKKAHRQPRTIIEH